MFASINYTVDKFRVLQSFEVLWVKLLTLVWCCREKCLHLSKAQWDYGLHAFITSSVIQISSNQSAPLFFLRSSSVVSNIFVNLRILKLIGNFNFNFIILHLEVHLQVRVRHLTLTYHHKKIQSKKHSVLFKVINIVYYLWAFLNWIIL